MQLLADTAVRRPARLRHRLQPVDVHPIFHLSRSSPADSFSTGSAAWSRPPPPPCSTARFSAASTSGSLPAYFRTPYRRTDQSFHQLQPVRHLRTHLLPGRPPQRPAGAAGCASPRRGCPGRRSSSTGCRFSTSRSSTTSPPASSPLTARTDHLLQPGGRTDHRLFSGSRFSASPLRTAFRKFCSQEQQGRNVCDLEKRDGTVIRAGYSFAYLNMPEDNGEEGKRTRWKVITLQDISQIERMECQIREAEKMVAIGEMSASIAHDFRNPLAAISGSAQTPGPGPGDSALERPSPTRPFWRWHRP